MLFKNKSCSKCGSNYDEALRACPKCHERNEDFDSYHLSKNLIMLPIWAQILLFVIGYAYIGLLLIQTVILLIMGDFDPTDGNAFFVYVAVEYLVLFLFLFLIIIPNRSRFFSGFKRWQDYLYGLGYALAIMFAGTTIGIIIQAIYPAGVNQNQTNVDIVTQAQPIGTLFIVGLIGPICEELTYRVGLFSFLRRVNRWVAYIVTILLFALIHFTFEAENMIDELLSLPVYLSAGLILCIAYEHRGPACSITAHVAYNTISTILSLTILGQ